LHPHLSPAVIDFCTYDSGGGGHLFGDDEFG
jgi:hypothetical protein